MLNINDLLKELEVGEYGYELENYSGNTYISDAISEIADSNTSIYYYDIIKFISENVEEVNNTICEFGWDGCGNDLYKAGQLAEYCTIQNEIYNSLEDALKNYAYKYYVQCTDSTEISDELNEKIMEACESNPDRFYEITDIIDEYLNELEEMEETE